MAQVSALRFLSNLQKAGYRRRILPIHPAASELEGMPAYPTLAAVPGDIDLAEISVPTSQVAAVARDAAAKHVKALVVITAGFSETGAVGRALEAGLLDIVRGAGMRMIGPNCMGVLNAASGVQLNATFAPTFPPAGRVSALLDGCPEVLELDPVSVFADGVAALDVRLRVGPAKVSPSTRRVRF